MLSIKFIRQLKMLRLEIEDNGIGREKSSEYKQIDNLDYKSMATLITQERIKVLNKRKKRK